MQTRTTQTRPIDRSNLDTTCAPCTDFYQFANGGWVKHNPVPPAYSRWGSFMELRDNALEAGHVILDSLVRNRASLTDPAIAKLADFYTSCMDTARIDADGIGALAGQLAMIDALNSGTDIQHYIAQRHQSGNGVLFSFGSVSDAKNSSDVIAGVYQGGLGLPDRDYYFKDDSASRAIRSAYHAHVGRLLVLAGVPMPEARRQAERAIALEHRIAAASLTRTEARDPVATYNKKTRAELAAMTPAFSWDTFFSQIGLSDVSAITVQNPRMMTTLDAMFRDVPLNDWKAYFRWHAVRSAASALSKPFRDEVFAFQQTLTGTKEQLPRYKQCIQAVDGYMGDAYGKAYVEKHFSPSAKERAQEMVQNLKEAFRDRLATRTWMSDETRKAAYEKLDAFVDKIGYPDQWKDYTSLSVASGNSYYQNILAARHFREVEDYQRIGKPVDRTRWHMTAPTVNAYYNAQLNEIVFPAGILQPPFFDPNADDAVNYGGIGAVIGHEMTHGFDDKGSQYDAKGNLRNWFTEDDLNNFVARTGLVAEQFDGYTILNDSTLHVNGKLTLGENIADLGGLTVAYEAFKKTLEGKPRPPLIDGFTPEQRFFLAWAQVWRGNTLPAQARLLLTVDSHSPGEWRTNGPLANMPEFREAWGCQTGDPMVRAEDKRPDIW